MNTHQIHSYCPFHAISLVQRHQDLFSSYHKTTNKSTLHKTAIVFPVRFSHSVFQHGATFSSFLSQNVICEYSLLCTCLLFLPLGVATAVIIVSTIMRHAFYTFVYFSYHGLLALAEDPDLTVCFSRTTKQELICDAQFHWSAPLKFRSN